MWLCTRYPTHQAEVLDNVCNDYVHYTSMNLGLQLYASIVYIVTGTHKMIITSPIGEVPTYIKESGSQPERNLHHCFKLEQQSSSNSCIMEPERSLSRWQQGIIFFLVSLLVTVEKPLLLLMQVLPDNCHIVKTQICCFNKVTECL